MPFGFGGGVSNTSSNFSGSGTSTANSNFSQTNNQTLAPTNPDWVSQGAQGFDASLQNLAGTNPLSYVTGPNALQYQAAGNAANLNTNPGNINGALDLTRGVSADATPQSTATNAAPYIDSYYNPYVNDVVRATRADLDASDAQTRAQQSLDLAHSGAFGGSGAAITQALTAGQLERARATTLGNLRAQGYTDALGAAQNDANNAQGVYNLNAQLLGQGQDRTLNAAAQMGALSTANDANTRANITTQGATGDALRQITQQQATAPLDFQSWLTQNFSNLPLSLFQGQTQAGTQTGTEDQTGTQTQSGKSNSTNVNANVKFG